MPVIHRQKSLTKLISRHKYILLGLSLLVLTVYANGLNNAFVSDDIAWFLNNPRLGDWGWLLTFPGRAGMWAVFFLAHTVSGNNPFFYRLTNVLFHLGNTLIIYLLFNLLYHNKRLAIFTASLFAVHPILIESVTWVAGGSQAMYAFFFLLAFLFYILSQTKPGKKLYLASLAVFTTSFFFSEKAVSLAIIFLVFEIAFGSVKKNWQRLVPYFTLAGIFIYIQFTKVEGRVAGLAAHNYMKPGLYNPLVQIPVAITEYLRLIFWPQELTLYHSELSFTYLEYLVRIGLFLVFIGMIAFTYWKIRDRELSQMIKFWQTAPKTDNTGNDRYVFFWLCFFIITLLPVLTPLQIAWVVAERYVYLGTLGILAVTGLVLKKLSEKDKFRTGVYVLFALFILLLSIRTIRRNADWKNQDTLWIATAKTSPSSPNTHNNMGDVYVRHGKLKKAVQEFKKAIAIKPDYADAYHNLANTYQKMAAKSDSQSKRYLKLTIENYQKAIQLNPNLWQSYQNLGAIYFGKKDYATAETFLKNGIKANPQNLNLQYSLGIVYLKAGKKDLARTVFLSILKANPTNPKVINALNAAEKP